MSDDVLTGLSSLVRLQLGERQWKKIEAFLVAERFGRPPKSDTGEAFSDRVRLTFDALRVTPTTPGPIDAGTPRDAAAVDAPRPGTDTGSPTSDLAVVAPDVGADPDAGAADADGLVSIEDGSGCACRVGHGARGRPGGALSLLALTLLAARGGKRSRRERVGASTGSYG
jgi:hypothetical protein